jgi:hypothetical protein
MKPTSEIIDIVKLIDNGITIFLNNANEIEIGEYESIVECRLILNLCIRHIESINELAKQDLLFAPSAMVLGRSSFESAINALWLIYPQDIFECESRYNGRLKNYEEWIGKQIRFFNDLGWDTKNYTEEKKSLSEFINDLDIELNRKGYETIKQVNFKSQLKKINEEQKYLYYKLLSGFTHGGYHSTNIYRKNLGTKMSFGEFINIDDWKFVYSVVWPAFEIASEFFIAKASKGNIKNIYSEDFKNEIRNLLVIKNI